MPDKPQGTDWARDVRKYVPDADDAVIAGIVRHCGIALRSRDASLVSFGDKAETDRVRESFCKKKLGLTEPDEVLDAAIAGVGARMSDTTFRNRVTVYYLLAEHFRKLALFGGTAKAAAPAMPLAPAPANQAAPAAEVAPLSTVAAVAPVAVAAAPTPQPIPPGVRGVAGPRPASEGGEFFGLAALVFGVGATIMLVAAIAAMYVGSRSQEAVARGAEEVLAAASQERALVEAAIPEGAGIVSEVIDGRPKVSVYFDIGMADISPQFVAAAEPITAWLDANPDDKVQLSGFTDPTGDAVQNAALAKARAEAVAAALAAQGVAPERIDLVKPDDVSDAAAELSAARRVEIAVLAS